MTQDVQQPDPLVGSTVAGKYRIVRLLGEGGMGCVYLAEQQLGSTARKVALKTLHKHLSHDPHIQARFDREAGTVAALEHPNTIQVFDYGKMDDGTLYIVMEYVQGQSVADLLVKEGAMPPARVENIMRQVCGSLEEAHGHGIIHRDLKPDNVVLCERAGQKDWVEVLDFGIAKRSSEHDPNEAKLTQQGMVLGTPPYMSPEQFTGQPIDVRSDIYALGVMAYEMLTANLPFEANTAWEWASKHMTEPPRPIETQPLGPNVPERMRAAITRALAKNRDERFASVKEFFEAFSTGGAQPAAAAPVVTGGRAKTEMATPAMMGGAAPGVIATPPPYGAPAASVPGPGAPAVPAGPSASATNAAHAKKGGGSGLVIGLGVAAVLLLGGGIAAFALKSKPKPPVVTTSVDLGGAQRASHEADAGAATAEAPTDVPSTAPLTPAGHTAQAHAGGGPTPKAVSADAGPAPKGSIPTPIPKDPPKQEPPPKVDPPACVKARSAKQRGSPAAIVSALEAQCRSAGGTP